MSIHGLFHRAGGVVASQFEFHRPRKALGTLAMIGFSAICALTGCGGASSSLVASVTLAVTTTSLPAGQVGTSYSATLAATGGKTPYTWSLTNGTLPAGLALNATTGAITGTPTAAASATALTFTVTDSSSPAQSKSASLSLTIAAAGTAPLSITTTSLPIGQVGASYSAILAATGGITPYSWALTSGALPAGLTLNPSSGAITGTPTAAASSVALTFTVTDSSSPAQSKSVSLPLTIVAVGTVPLSITTISLPSGQVGTSYSATLAAIGGTTPYSWALTSGTLPAGLVLNSSTGTITGIPTATASATALIFTVTDSGSPAQTQSVSLSLTIAVVSSPTLAITTSSLPNGQVGAVYSATLAATGGTAPYTWALTSGTLPAGLALNAGAISGTPTAAASAATLTFTVTDSSSPAQAATAHLTLTIAASASGPLTIITTTPLPNGQVGTAYSATLTATGGTTPYAWTLTGGTLPAGLALNTSTGAIAGTPTATANNILLSFSVTDSSSPQQTKSVSLQLYISSSGASTLAITSSALPNGQDGNAYGATLAATGGTTPYSWSVTSGTLPAGLMLNAATGAITGTPTATASATPLTFSVSDSSVPTQTQSVNLALTVYSSNGISVSVSPQNAGLTITQALSLTPTTTDSAGVTWSVTGSGCSGTACGSFSSTTSLTGVAVTYTAPNSPGFYTITASSVTNNTIAATATVGVTDLAGMTTYHNDLSRDGANTQEYALNTSNVTTSTFGKLFSCAVDEAIYTQPLWVANLTVNGAMHNVVFVATQNDSLYAFDADNNSTPCTPLWQVNLLDGPHGGTPNEASVPSSGHNSVVGYGNGDIQPEVGVTGTPVIDPTTNTLYVVSKSYVASGPTFFQRLHAIDLTTGNEKSSSPVDIAATFPGNGDNSAITTFVPQEENQRCALALVNGVVYIAWASHEDAPPFYGWVIGYAASDLTAPPYVFNDVPNAPSSPMEGVAGDGGIWMSGGAPAADSNGNLYLITGNGSFDNTTGDYGDSFLQLSPNPNGPSLTVNQYFTPTDQLTDSQNDFDFGSGGAAVLIDLPANGSNPTHLVVGGGKDANLYILNRDALGGYGDSNAWQEVPLASGGFHGIFSTAAFWNSTLYIATFLGPLQAFSLNPTTAYLTQLPNGSPESFARFGPTASVSSTPAPDYSNGIVWVIDSGQYCTNGSPGCGPSVLRAYDAGNLSSELWNSSMGSGNTAGNAVKFTVPTIANGKVYVGTRGNNAGGADNSSSTPGELDVYGLLPN